MIKNSNHLQKFVSKIKSRGIRGVLGIERLFRLIDEDQSNTISLNEFIKAC